jgi:hypothetical protein
MSSPRDRLEEMNMDWHAGIPGGIHRICPDRQLSKTGILSPFQNA